MTFTPGKIKPSSHWFLPAILAQEVGTWKPWLQHPGTFQNMALILMFNVRLKTITNDIM